MQPGRTVRFNTADGAEYPVDAFGMKTQTRVSEEVERPTSTLKSFRSIVAETLASIGHEVEDLVPLDRPGTKDWSEEDVEAAGNTSAAAPRASSQQQQQQQQQHEENEQQQEQEEQQQQVEKQEELEGASSSPILASTTGQKQKQVRLPIPRLEAIRKAQQRAELLRSESSPPSLLARSASSIGAIGAGTVLPPAAEPAAGSAKPEAGAEDEVDQYPSPAPPASGQLEGGGVGEVVEQVSRGGAEVPPDSRVVAPPAPPPVTSAVSNYPASLLEGDPRRRTTRTVNASQAAERRRARSFTAAKRGDLAADPAELMWLVERRYQRPAAMSERPAVGPGGADDDNNEVALNIQSTSTAADGAKSAATTASCASSIPSKEQPCAFVPGVSTTERHARRDVENIDLLEKFGVAPSKLMTATEWKAQYKRFQSLEQEYERLREPVAKIQFLKLRRSKRLHQLEKQCDKYARGVNLEIEGYKEVLRELIPYSEDKPSARHILEKHQVIRGAAQRDPSENPNRLYTTLRSSIPCPDDWILRALQISFERGDEWGMVSELLEKQIPLLARDAQEKLASLQKELTGLIGEKMQTVYLQHLNTNNNLAETTKKLKTEAESLRVQESEMRSKLEDLHLLHTKLKARNDEDFEELSFGYEARKQIPDKIIEAEGRGRQVFLAMREQEKRQHERLDKAQMRSAELTDKIDHTLEELNLSKEDLEQARKKNTKIFFKLRAAKPSVSTRYATFYR